MGNAVEEYQETEVQHGEEVYGGPIGGAMADVDKLREKVLTTARSLVCADREAQYGPPRENFSRIAALWSVTLGIEVAPWQVAMCMGQVKDARTIFNPKKLDNWTDRAGYTALGAELAMED